MGSHFPKIDRFVFTASLVREVVECLRIDGSQGNEGILFLAGSLGPDRIATVDAVLVPVGRGVVKRPLHCSISAETMNALGKALGRPEAVLLMQVHTHKCFPTHSPTDDSYAFKSQGFVSVVIDHFAVEDPPDPIDWKYHECDERGSFRIWPDSEVRRRILSNGQHQFRRMEVHE
jgi:hypothetical protein